MDFVLLAETSHWLKPDTWWNLFQVAAGLGFVIFVHELGHFLVAKACGVKCEKFYIGFDVPFGAMLNSLLGREGEFKLLGVGIPKTIGRPIQYGETEYGIGIIPLGGYVKMLGQDDNPANAQKEAERTRMQQDEQHSTTGDGEGSETSPVEDHHRSVTDVDMEPQPLADQVDYDLDPRSYTAKNVPQRMAIISAGVIMNVIFAAVFATIAYYQGVPYTPTIIGGTSAGSPAWIAGLQPGGQIVQLGRSGGERKHLRYLQDLTQYVGLAGIGKVVELKIRSGGGTQWVKLQPVQHPQTKRKIGMIGVQPLNSLKLPEKNPTIDFLAAGNASEPILPGDKFVAGEAAGESEEFATYIDLEAFLSRHVDEPITLTMERVTGEPAGPDQPPPTKQIKTTIAPNPMRRLGLQMTIGPIVAVQQGLAGGGRRAAGWRRDPQVERRAGRRPRRAARPTPAAGRQARRAYRRAQSRRRGQDGRDHAHAPRPSPVPSRGVAGRTDGGRSDRRSVLHHRQSARRAARQRR